MKRLILIFLLISFGSFAQTKPSGKHLRKLFKKSIEQKKRSRISITSNEWEINNLNNEYNESDTLKVYNYNRNSSNRFCEYIGWTFYRKDSFILSKAHHCDEPARISVPKNEDWYKVKVLETEYETILQLYNFDKLISQFKVLTVKASDLEIELILVRIK